MSFTKTIINAIKVWVNSKFKSIESKYINIENKYINVENDLNNKQPAGDYVTAIDGKGLSTEDYTSEEKEKLAGIANGANKNVQPDLLEADATSDAYILNVPNWLRSGSAGNSIFMSATNPVGRGSFSMNKADGGEVGESSHTEGSDSLASGKYAHAEGRRTKATGTASHAEGWSTTASASSSHAEGNGTNASGYVSHAEGEETVASGTDSHAEGRRTNASGYASHAEGNGTNASGYISHAEGEDTIASGNASHAEGIGTVASSDYQHVQGQYNIIDEIDSGRYGRGTYAHIVGNGTNYARSNAHTLDWCGNGWFARDVYIGGTGQDDINAKKLATEDFVYNSNSVAKENVALIDQINGYTYIVCMRDGNIVSCCAVKSIEVTTMPTKTEYMAGEYFDPSGMVVTATLQDGTTRIIENYVCQESYLREGDDAFAKISLIEAGIVHHTTIPVTVVPFDAELILVDFEYTNNNDGTYTITGWKGTYNGEASTEMIIPNYGCIIV